MNSASALTLCRSQALSHAGRRSARLAALIHRMGLMAGRCRLRGRSDARIRRRMPAISRAYLTALETDRLQ